MPVKDEIIGDGLDFIVIRELAGGLYYGEPRGIEPHADGERGCNTLAYTTREIDRVVRAGFELARKRSKKAHLCGEGEHAGKFKTLARSCDKG